VIAGLLVAEQLRACEEVSLTSPPRSSTVAEARPTLTWPVLPSRLLFASPSSRGGHFAFIADD
jgi:hypothetical protein